jgi:hypothetical protein
MRKRHYLLAIALLIVAATSLGARRSDLQRKRRGVTLAPSALVTTDLSQGVTATDLVNALLGPGFTAEVIQYSGALTAAGTFAGGTGILGFESGIILGSGCVSNIAGPNVSDSISCDHVLPGDPALDTLSGFTTFDATVLEFDFEPDNWDNTTLLFSYVFTSDEYNEYVTTQYNDVFAFWVNGTNCALVPGLGPAPDPVTVNSINGDNPFGGPDARNPLLYRNNDLDDGGGSIDTEMDGLTVVLSCQAPLLPRTTNHIRLAIADASDGIYDSNVMIRAQSFASTDLVITLDPPTAVNPVGTSHTVTATLRNAAGVPQAGHETLFSVISGPNAGATGTCSVHADCTTDVDGVVHFTYTGGPTPGVDVLRACFDDAGGNENCSLGVTKEWVPPCGPDGTPCGNLHASCEIQDTCSNDLCHDNGFMPQGTPCRDPATMCDLPESCTGVDAACPLDQHVPDGTACDDQNTCTEADGCTAGVCAGSPLPLPAEVDDGVRMDMMAGAAWLRWNLAPGAIGSDVLRGLTKALPVGPGGDDETCLGSDLTDTVILDRAIPATGDAYWYLVRGVNACGHGPYGSGAVPQVSSTCP